MFPLVTSLPAMTSQDRFCFSRKGGIGGGGWVHPRGRQHGCLWTLLLKTPWLAPSGRLLSPMHKRVEKTVLWCRQHGCLWALLWNALVGSEWTTAVLLCKNT